MKIIPASLLSHYQSGNTSVAFALLLQRADGSLFGFTSASQPLILDISPWGSASWGLAGETEFTFSSSQGLDASTIVSTAGFSVDNLVLTTLDDGTLFDRKEILAGRWRGTRFRLFRYRWDVVTTIADDVETLVRGTLGEFDLGETQIGVELRGLKQGLQQSIGIVSQPTCRARFASQGPGQCNIDPAPYTFNLTVTGVTDDKTFTASAATQDPDFFGYGVVTWLTGFNAGVSMQVGSFGSGVFTLSLPSVFDIQVGDTFTALAGCRGRRDEDCFTKFNNVVNMQAEPDRPTQDRVLSGI